MKTRIIKTKIWTDSKFLSLSSNARYLLTFLLTSPYVGMSNYFECPDIFITTHTGIKSLDLIKEELSSQRLAIFYEGWVFMPNLEKHNNYKGSSRNENAYNSEIDSIPKDILKYFDSTIYSSIDSTMHSTHNTKTKNHNTKIKNQKSKIKNDFEKISDIKEQDLQEISEKYNVPLAFVKSKLDDMELWGPQQTPSKIKNRNWKLTLMKWVKDDALKIKSKNHDRSNIDFIDPA